MRSSCRPTIVDQLYIDDFYLWAREDVAWDPLCGHLSIIEKVGPNVELTEADLIAVAAASKERVRSKTERYRKKKRDDDEAAYLKRGLDTHQAWSAKNPGRVKDIAAGVTKKAKDSGRFRCLRCSKNFASDSALKTHKTSTRHKNAPH